MTKKMSLICFICIIVGMIFVNIPQKPKIISSLTVLDTSYLTILVDKFERRNPEKLEDKILQMYKDDSFENIKLQTEEKPLARKFYISVYTSKAELERGIPFLVIKNDAKD